VKTSAQVQEHFFVDGFLGTTRLALGEALSMTAAETMARIALDRWQGRSDARVEIRRVVVRRSSAREVTTVRWSGGAVVRSTREVHRV
jgi:phosphatidylserine/phosphatidylglycerophosphate/cardiolipin synthase-like enzyme